MNVIGTFRSAALDPCSFTGVMGTTNWEARTALIVFLTAFSLTAKVVAAGQSTPEAKVYEEPALSSELNAAFNLRLFAKDDALVVRFPNGSNATFLPAQTTLAYRLRPDPHYDHELLGSIKTRAVTRVWSLNTTDSIEFLGSYPIKVISQGQPEVSLRYKNGTLRAVTSTGSSPPVDTPYTSGAIVNAQRVILNAARQICPQANSDSEDQSNETSSAYAATQETLDEPESCTSTDAPLPLGFTDPVEHPLIRVDIRPSDCQSYFSAFPSIQRGTAIEEAIGNHPPYFGSQSGAHSFPVADYWNNGNVYVLISRDLTALSYDAVLNPDALYEQLMDDGENIHDSLITPLNEIGEISHTQLGESTTLQLSDAQVFHLDIVVQYGVTTPAQHAMIERASAELLDQYGIVVRIIEIP